MGELLRKTFIWSVSVLFLSTYSDSAKILLTPLNINSHVVFFTQLGRGLLSQGHDVTLILASNAKFEKETSGPDIHVQRFKCEGEQYVTSKEHNIQMIQAALSNNAFTRAMRFLKVSDKVLSSWTLECEQMFRDEQLLKDIKYRNYDFVIVDGAYPACFTALAYKFDLPYALFSIYIKVLNFRVPALPSLGSSGMASFTTETSFLNRVTNTAFELLQAGITYVFLGFNTTSAFVPEKPAISYFDLFQDAKLYFYLFDPVLFEPKPLMPNTVMLGDIMARPAKPLPHDLDLVVSRAPHGVIIVSFGTMMTSMPERISRTIFEALGNLNELVIMKKAGYIPEEVAENIILLPWLPQNDLLGQEKVKLFVSHCGLNSIIESLYHGKPILAVPIGLDQPLNAGSVVAKGYGRMLTFKDLTVDALGAELHELLNNNSYTETAVRLSRIFRDQPETAAERASFWIKHVLTHGDAHLRTGAYELNLAQFLLIDVYIFFLVILIVLMFFIYFCVRSCCGCCRRCFCHRASKPKRD